MEVKEIIKEYLEKKGYDGLESENKNCCCFYKNNYFMSCRLDRDVASCRPFKRKNAIKEGV